MSEVTLKVTIDGDYLAVSQRGNAAHLHQPGEKLTITWQLTDNAASGTFNAMDDPDNPGFSWVKQPPDGIFSGLQLRPGGKQISLTDTESSNPLGAWIYKLCATINGRLYSTDPAPNPTAAHSMIVDFASNPTIQNR